jgi:S-adenosylmethionine hydrolase
MHSPLFILLTDFGYDFAVASMKGVILKKIRNAQIIDLDHFIEKFNIASASFVLGKSYHYFPSGSTFISIVDPGVGSEREPLCIQAGGYTFVGPNNGVFSDVLHREIPNKIWRISESAYLNGTLNTFHGRDLFAPAAADFYLGNTNNFTFFKKEQLISLASVLSYDFIAYIDSFGNIKTTIFADEHFAPEKESVAIRINGIPFTTVFVKTFSDVPHLTTLCYVGSNNTLEIAVSGGSAAQAYHASVGDRIEVLI